MQLNEPKGFAVSYTAQKGYMRTAAMNFHLTFQNELFHMQSFYYCNLFALLIEKHKLYA